MAKQKAEDAGEPPFEAAASTGPALPPGGMIWAPEELDARVFHSFLSWAVTTGRRYKLPPGRVVALVRDLVGGPVTPGFWSAGRDATP